MDYHYNMAFHLSQVAVLFPVGARILCVLPKILPWQGGSSIDNLTGGTMAAERMSIEERYKLLRLLQKPYRQANRAGKTRLTIWR